MAYLLSASQPTANTWFQTPPLTSQLQINDPEYAVFLALRLQMWTSVLGCEEEALLGKACACGAKLTLYHIKSCMQKYIY